MSSEVEMSEGLRGTHVYDGLRFSRYMTPTALDAVKNVRFYPEDLLVLTYPKSGTTWVQEISWLVQHDANIKESYKDHRDCRMPYLDIQNPNQNQPEVLKMPNIPPRLMKSHLPTWFLEKKIIEGNSKVIIVRRDLKDTLVSFFNQYKNHPEILYEGTWDMFFELFKKRQLYYGDWGEFYNGWQKYKDNPNFLFLQYETMKKDPHQAVLMVAKHCNKVLTEEQVDKIVHHTGFEQMRANLKMSNTIVKNFYRKGVIGDWGNYFSADQISYIEDYERELHL